MENSVTDQIITNIGTFLHDYLKGSADGVLLYAELGENMVSVNIYKSCGNSIIYVDEDGDESSWALLDLWNAQGTEEHWEEVEYTLRADKFAVAFTYPDEIDPDEDKLKRRDRIVRRHFGEKPIVYPPLLLPDGQPAYDV